MNKYDANVSFFFFFFFRFRLLFQFIFGLLSLNLDNCGSTMLEIYFLY